MDRSTKIWLIALGVAVYALWTAQLRVSPQYPSSDVHDINQTHAAAIGPDFVVTLGSDLPLEGGWTMGTRSDSLE